MADFTDSSTSPVLLMNDRLSRSTGLESTVQVKKNNVWPEEGLLKIKKYKTFSGSQTLLKFLSHRKDLRVVPLQHFKTSRVISTRAARPSPIGRPSQLLEY